MLMRLMILVCMCNYEEDEKNRKILVGYGILAETSVLTPIPRNTMFHADYMSHDRPLRLESGNWPPGGLIVSSRRT